MVPRIHSEVSPALTEKAVKALTDALEKGLQALNEATQDLSSGPHRFDMSFSWIRILSEKEPGRISSVVYRIESVLLLPEGNDWKRIPGYCDSFANQIAFEDTTYDGLYNGVIGVMHKAYLLVAPTE